MTAPGTADAPTPERHAWWASTRRVFSDQTGGAALLLIATITALVWVNSPFGSSYEALWHTEFRIGIGDSEFALDLRHWVNDGLMAFFFFIVTLEVKRELVIGEFADRRRAAVPALAALAGLVLPAVIYVLFNLGDSAVAAWGVVISTDTAFLLGMLALLGAACPPQLRVFLLALAIADDVGALTVIALFYTSDLRLLPLLAALLTLALMFGLRWLRVWRGPAYLVLAVVGWAALYLSGIHATLLGVAIALSTPAYLARRSDVDDAVRLARAYQQSPNPEFARAARLSIDRSVPPGERQQTLWRPWTNYVFVPIFALANAGVPLSVDALRQAATSSVTLGVIAGLVLGKLIGIVAGTELAVRLHLGRLAPGLRLPHIAGGAALSGIGFTISLLIVDLAFDDDAKANQARIGILAASLLAALLGSGLLIGVHRRLDHDSGTPTLLDPPVDPACDHIRGPVDAPLTLLGFGDFTAPYRGRGAISELHERLGNRFRYVFRHAPADPTRPHAQLAAEAAEAAGAQGRFWEMHDRMFDTDDELSPSELLSYAEDMGLDMQRFARDLGSGRYSGHVAHDLESALASGYTGTPTFFVNGHRHIGPHDAQTLAAALLAEAEENATAGALHDPAAPSSAAVVAAVGEQHPEQQLPDLPADLPETPDQGGDHPRLTDTQITHLASAGSRKQTARGDVLYRPGDPEYAFHVVLSGTVAVVGQIGEDVPVIRVHGPGRFLGALDLFEDRPVQRSAVVVRSGEVLRLTVDQLREVFDQHPDIRDIVVRAYLVRSAIGYQLSADLRILGNTDSHRIAQMRDAAVARGLTVHIIDVAGDEYGKRLLRELDIAQSDLPVVLTRSGEILYDPSDSELSAIHPSQ